MLNEQENQEGYARSWEAEAPEVPDYKIAVRSDGLWVRTPSVQVKDIGWKAKAENVLPGAPRFNSLRSWLCELTSSFKLHRTGRPDRSLRYAG